MRVLLKKITLIGFKTFRDPTEIVFPIGLTAVVGPNGSGKSNIVDALLWAVGHQSAKALRGDRMEDVIFAGNSHYPPAGLAEVQLTFCVQNDGEEEIMTLTRRLFRDDISEYEINGKKARLKDVLDFCDEYRILTHSYSVVPQGQILLICEMRPQEMRRFLEDVAGISIYKRKKAETELKLEATRNNIERLLDIKEELVRQWEIKKDQAQKTQRFMDLQSRVHKLQCAALVAQARRVRRKLEITEDLLAEARRLLDPVEKQWLDLKQKRDEAWTYVENLQQERESSHTASKRIQVDIRRLQKELEKLDDGIRSKEHESLDVEKTLERVIGQENIITKQETELKRELTHFENVLIELERRYQKREMEWNTLKTEWEELDRKLVNVGEKIAGFDARLDEGKAQADYWKSIGQKLREDHERSEIHWKELTQQVDLLKEHKERAASELANARSHLVSIQRQESELSEIIRDTEQRLRQKQADYDKRVESLKQLKHEIKALEDVLKKIERWAGEGDDPLKRLRSAGLTGRVFPVRAWFSSNEDTGSKSLSLLPIFFADWVTYYRKDAEQVHNIFSECGMPACSIWILEEIEKTYGLKTSSSKDFSEDNLKLTFMSWLSILEREHEKTQEEDRRWHPLASGLGMTTGCVIHYPGSGVVADAAVWIDTRRRLAEYCNREKRLTEELETIKENVDEYQVEFKEKNILLDSIKNKLKIASDHVNRCIHEFNTAESRLVQITEKCARVQTELRNLGNALQQAEEQRTRWQEQEKSIIKEHDELFHLQNELRKRREQLLVNREVQDKERMELLQETGGIRSRVQQLQNDLKALDAQIEGYHEERKKLSGILEQFHTSLLKMRDQRKKIRSLLIEKEQERDRLEARVQSLEDDFQLNMQNLQKWEAKLSEVQEQRNRSLDQIRSREVEYADLLSRWNALAEKYKSMDEDRNLEVLVQKGMKFTADDQKLLAELQRELDELGPVNPLAMEEFAEVEERLRFYRDQEQDLRESMEALTAATEKLDQKMAERLYRTSEEMNKALNEYLQTFLDGSGEFKWSDENDILNSNVEIRVHIPGKRIRSLMQLSGGEKTMVGLALVMSAHRIRPSAFLILDEVDSPLDDTNVNRLMSVLCHPGMEGQFILVTHNKQTIQYAQAIYGVTLRGGSSKIVSMRLDEARRVIDEARKGEAQTRKELST